MWALTRNNLLSYLSASRHLPSSPISPGSWNSGKSNKYRDEMWLVSDWWKSLQLNDADNNGFQVHRVLGFCLDDPLPKCSCASYGCNKLPQIWTQNLQTPVLDLHLTKQVVYIIAWTWQKVSTVDGLGWPWPCFINVCVDLLRLISGFLPSGALTGRGSPPHSKAVMRATEWQQSNGSPWRSECQAQTAETELVWSTSWVSFSISSNWIPLQTTVLPAGNMGIVHSCFLPFTHTSKSIYAHKYWQIQYTQTSWNIYRLCLFGKINPQIRRSLLALLVEEIPPPRPLSWSPEGSWKTYVTWAGCIDTSVIWQWSPDTFGSKSMHGKIESKGLYKFYLKLNVPV